MHIYEGVYIWPENTIGIIILNKKNNIWYT